MTKLLLIDGSNYLFRAYHALPPLTTSSGEPTGAIKGFHAMLRNVYSKIAPDYVACVFDAHAKTFRHTIFPEYKANRPPMPEDLRVQLEPIRQMVRLLGWPLLQVEGVEADDVLATLACRASAEGIEAFIATGDKDLAQVVTERICLVNTMTHEVLGREGVKTKYGVYPERIVDYLTLMGDKVDNVPGINKCGPKTAVKWLDEFGSLQGVIEAAPSVKGKIGEYLREGIPNLVLSQRLVTIKPDVSLDVNLQDLVLRPASDSELAAFYARWQMRVPGRKEAVKTVTPLPSVPPKAPTVGAQTDLFSFGDGAASVPYFFQDGPLPFTTVDSEAALKALATRLLSLTDSPVAVALLTDRLLPIHDTAAALAFAVTPLEVYVVPTKSRGGFSFESVKSVLAPWLSSEAPKVFHDAKYARHVLANMDLPLGGIPDDVMLASYILEAHMNHTLSGLSLRHLATVLAEEEAIFGKGTLRQKAADIDSAKAYPWLAQEAAVIKTLGGVLGEKLAREKALKNLYREMELPVSAVLWSMERTGVCVDTGLLAQESAALATRIDQIEEKITVLAGEAVNPASPKQLAHILFEKLELPVKKKTSGGTPSTSEEVLAELALDYPIAEQILEYRKLTKLKNTYTDKLPSMVDATDARVHTTFGQATAVTGRLASSEPNLQNIPVRTPEGRRVRAAFVAKAGCVIVSADYSQIELRLMAHLSGDKRLIAAFTAGDDVHRATASEVFGVALDAVTNEQRRMAKVINFGLIYGMSAFGLAKNLGIDRTSAKRYMDEYFARYPGVARYMETARREAVEKGFVRTIWGRRLWIPELKSPNAQVRAAAERAAINAPVQGSAADVIKRAMIAVDAWIRKEKLKTRLILQVHDELVFEVPEDEIDRVKEAVPRLMAGVAHFEIPLLTQVGVASNWEAAH